MIRNEVLVQIAMSMLPELEGSKLHFSFITYKNNIISIGTNLNKTHTKAKTLGYRFPCIHSEMSAFLKVRKGTDLSRCRLVNIRLSRASVKKKTPILRMSKPCENCLPWCSGTFKEIIFTQDDGFYSLS